MNYRIQTPPSTHAGDKTPRLITKKALALDPQQSKAIDPTPAVTEPSRANDEDGKDPTEEVEGNYNPSS